MILWKYNFTYEKLGKSSQTFGKFNSGIRNISRNLSREIISSMQSLISQDSGLLLESCTELKELSLVVNSDVKWDKIVISGPTTDCKWSALMHIAYTG